jgi:hypothetical protein
MDEQLAMTYALYNQRYLVAARRIAADLALGRQPERHDVRQAESYAGLMKHTEGLMTV